MTFNTFKNFLSDFRVACHFNFIMMSTKEASRKEEGQLHVRNNADVESHVLKSQTYLYIAQIGGVEFLFSHIDYRLSPKQHISLPSSDVLDF